MPSRVVAFLVVLALSPKSGAAPVRVLPSAAGERARLGVVIVVDQLAQAHLDRWGDLLGDDGLRRLMRGHVALDARYLGAPTATAHGHATLGTGTYAARHGIVSNDWFDRATGRRTWAAHDPSTTLVPADAKGEGASTHQLLAPTIGDALRLSLPGAKVVSLAIKSRGAVFLAGRRPDAIVWFSRDGRWVTSRAYAERPPAWVPSEAALASVTAWERFVPSAACALLPRPERPGSPPECARRLAERRAGSDDDAIESSPAGLGRTFPHPLPGADSPQRVEALLHTPLLDEALLDLAMRAIEGESLGADDVTDLLTISLGAFDYIGHAYGPDSHEAFDAFLRLDAALARFLRMLDAKVGPGRSIVALTADHGIRPSSLRLVREGHVAGEFDGDALAARVDAALDAGLGPREWIGAFASGGLSFRPDALAEVDRSRVDAIAVDVAMKTPGLAAAWPRSTFASMHVLRGDAAAFARSWFDGRSPDLVLHLLPGFQYAGDVASHGTPYLADARVPLVFFRSGRAGASLPGVVDVASLAPTFALLLGVPPPFAADAPVLESVVEALR